MTGVLADLTLESEAATTLALRLAGAADRASRGDAAEAALLRVALPAAKYWICKRTPMITGEALECLGGNGYVEESIMPRLLRDAPLNSIWEGSGNVTALDVLRALTRSPDSADALLADVDSAAGEPRVAAAAGALRAALKDVVTSADPQRQARRLAGQIAVTLQAALLARHAPAGVADAYCATRLGAGPGSGPGAPFGSLPDDLDTATILERSAVTVTK
jgi:putative acyl-CoA dehydrogenase